MVNSRKKSNIPEYKKKSEEMLQKASELVKDIANNYIQNPEKIAEALEFATRFPNYSARNCMLIAAQKPDAVYTQSFAAWKSMGCSVKAGAKGMMLFVPVQTTLLHIDGKTVSISNATKKQKEAYKKGEIEAETVTSFKIGYTFDIAQTTYPPEKYPELFSVGYPSETHDKICNGLIDYANKFINCKVEIEDLQSLTLRGYYDRGKHQIVLNSSLTGTQKLSTMAHELGHAIRHNLLDGSLSTSAKEFEADALSVMLESAYGLEITDARKEHLSNNFKNYVQELKEQLGDRVDDIFIENKITDILSSVQGTYCNIIEDVKACVDIYIEPQRVIRMTKEREKEIKNEFIKSNEITLSNNKNPEKTISLSMDMERDLDFDI